MKLNGFILPKCCLTTSAFEPVKTGLGCDDQTGKMTSREEICSNFLVSSLDKFSNNNNNNNNRFIISTIEPSTGKVCW